MKRGGPLRRDTPAARAFANQRSRLRPVSQKRRAQQPDRAAVREAVLARAAGRCEWAPVFPGVACAFYPPDRPGLEVDELRGGAYRSTEWLDPDACVATCPAHHDHKTTHKREALRRFASQEPPNAE